MTAMMPVRTDKWDDVWETLATTGELSLDDDLSHLDEAKREIVARTMDELSTLGFVTPEGPQTWVRAF